MLFQTNPPKQHAKKQKLYGHLPPISQTIQVRQTRHAGHCWNKFISDVLLWIPTHRCTRVSWPSRTYIHKLYEHWMQSRRPAMSNGWLGQMVRERESVESIKEPFVFCSILHSPFSLKSSFAVKFFFLCFVYSRQETLAWFQRWANHRFFVDSFPAHWLNFSKKRAWIMELIMKS